MIRTIPKWLFVYLPLRFTVPLLGLLVWFLFYLWPWLLDLFFTSGFERLLPVWVEALNLKPAAQAAGVLTVLGLGVLAVYNVAALAYQKTRRWSRQQIWIGIVLLNCLIYSYPWLFSPKDWTAGNFFFIPFYVSRRWTDGIGDYGILWLIPAAMMVIGLVAEVVDHRKASRLLHITTRVIEPPPLVNASFEELRRLRDLRIGLILSGGGAKGVYQAGAMRAIYEFLKQNDSLQNVKMIAGTSIGAWNSLFWLAGHIESHSGKMSVHEDWWNSANIERIIEFDKYIPFRANSLLSTRPWRENFDAIFGNDSLAPILRDSPLVRFYLTRSNVAQGRLEFSTNWGPAERMRALQSESIGIDSFIEAKSVEDIRDAVFASMDLPPLLPYQKIGDEYFEDGGVIDNLPIRFGTLVEECDLLFVLALNASFEAKPSFESVMKRLMRVMDVRQGVMERNSMRMAYLYNHINLLRGSTRSPAAKSKKLVRVFAICPQQPLEVNTGEFWKTESFGVAFRTMYTATRVELSQFDFMAVPAAATPDHKDWLRMALVSPAGEITYSYRF